MLILVSGGAVATGEHFGQLNSEVVEHQGAAVVATPPLARELRAALADGDADLRDVTAGPACPMTLGDVVVLRWGARTRHRRAAQRRPRAGHAGVAGRRGVVY